MEVLCSTSHRTHQLGEEIKVKKTRTLQQNCEIDIKFCQHIKIANKGKKFAPTVKGIAYLCNGCAKSSLILSIFFFKVTNATKTNFAEVCVPEWDSVSNRL
jgi:hypothetical protein